LDKAGRICLPEGMARAAGIKDEAVLVGLLDRFEIWNPELRKSQGFRRRAGARSLQTDGVIMNLGKLLVAGKSIMNGRAEISYRETNTFICPNSVWRKIHSSLRPGRNQPGGSGNHRRANQKSRHARCGQNAKIAALAGRRRARQAGRAN
jgi:hypothetical protein